MQEQNEKLPSSAPKPRRRLRLSVAIMVLALAAAGGAAWMYYFYFPGEIGPKQPISFSHRFHVTDKQISCFMCHSSAINTPRSGVPSLSTCMMCHKTIITTHPEIVKLRNYYESGSPPQWVRVNDLPDYAYFDHHVHVQAGFDCGRCHGDVSQMDRVKLVTDFEMGFCMQCHRDNKAPTDCYTCHR